MLARDTDDISLLPHSAASPSNIVQTHRQKYPTVYRPTAFGSPVLRLLCCRPRLFLFLPPGEPFIASRAQSVIPPRVPTTAVKSQISTLQHPSLVKTPVSHYRQSATKIRTLRPVFQRPSPSSGIRNLLPATHQNTSGFQRPSQQLRSARLQRFGEGEKREEDGGKKTPPAGQLSHVFPPAIFLHFGRSPRDQPRHPSQ